MILNLLVVILGAVAFGSSEEVYSGIINKNVLRNIDLNSQLARHTISVDLLNNGDKTVSFFHLAIESEQDKHLAFLEVVDEFKSTLSISKEANQKDFTLYRIALSKPLSPQGTVAVTVKETFTKAMKPFPAAIAQGERQFMQYSDNHYFFSPYTSQSQTTQVKLTNGNIPKKSELAPTSVKGDTITYGPFVDIKPYQHNELYVHFENNRPFVSVEAVTKEVEVSHWGNVAVEVDYKNLEHTGAKLKGTFSRYDYQRNPAATPASIASLKQVLPKGASDVYYRDEIGNISTSHVSPRDHSVVLDLIPRYPLFGGWKASFYIGWNLPLPSFLFTDSEDSSLYVLNISFSHSFDDVTIDNLVVRVILPEGAKNIKAHVPFSIDSETTATHWTYLDTTGRPVLVLSKKNVVPEHDKFFQVTYRFSQLSMLQEPLLLVIGYFAFFIFVMAYVRINFRIGPVKQRSNNADRIDDLLFKVKDIVEQRTEAHASFDSSLNKLLKTKNLQQYQADKKRTDQNLAANKREIQKIITELDELDAVAAKKVREIELKEDKKALYQTQIHENEISSRLEKKTPKLSGEESKTEIDKFYNAVDQEIDALLADLND